MSDHFVIVGAGQAAAQAIQTLRQRGFSGEITLIGEESFLPYQRPPLSKKYLAGELDRTRLTLRPEQFYERQGVNVELGVQAVGLDREPTELALDDGRRVGYDRLMLATGSRARKLRLRGSDLSGIHYLRTIADVDAIMEEFQAGRRLCIVGGGYIGLEVAAVAVTAGLTVTVLEAADRVMSRVVCPEVSRYYVNYHRHAGVDVRCSTEVEEFTGDGRVEGVKTTDGQVTPCDFVIVGAGVVPEISLAESAGLDCDDGVLVDEYARTSDDKIVAAGDCTSHPNRQIGRRVRLESVQNAIEQAKTAALSMLGESEPYTAVPWFWSDQYDLKLQIAGLSTASDTVVIRGDKREHPFAAFYLRAGRIAAVEGINSPKEFMIGKKLIAAGTTVEPSVLADLEVDLSKLLEG